MLAEDVHYMGRKIKKERLIPEPVLKAIVQRDSDATRYFGRRGNERQKLNRIARDRARQIEETETRNLPELWQRKPLWKKNLLLRGAWQMSREANEGICPVD